MEDIRGRVLKNLLGRDTSKNGKKRGTEYIEPHYVRRKDKKTGKFFYEEVTDVDDDTSSKKESERED